MNFNIKLLNLIKKRKKYINLFLDIEPKSKKVTTDKSKIQKKIIEKLKTRNWKCINGNIAIEITAYTNKRNPPQIEKFVKNIIDIMHKKELLINREDEVSLPFKDDKFIKYLRTKYVFLEGKSQIHVKIKPFSSFISDIHFVDTEIGSSYCSDKCSTKSWNEYRDFIDNKEDYLKVLSEEAYCTMVKFKTLDLQKEICDTISITPNIIGFLYPKQIKYAKYLKKIYKDWASMLLDVPIRLHLPGIPLDEAKKNNYKAEYREILKKICGNIW